MRLSLASFTAAGERLAARLAGLLAGEGHVVREIRRLRGGERPGLEDWAGAAFRESDGIIFIGACGIAVRAVAPLLRDKRTDPAVLAIDERGRYVVPLVSGHVGGANALALRAAALLGAAPVISTATDLNGTFAVDLWAAEQGIALTDRALAKAVSAALLDGRSVGFQSDFPVEGPLPEGLVETAELGLCVTLDGSRRPFPRTLAAIPRIVTLGIGCRRGVGAEAIGRVAGEALKRAGVDPRAVRAVASIDRKAEEPGLREFCARRGWPLRVYTAGRLAGVPGEFSGSCFVRDTVGVDNVCERAAAAEGGRLILRKYARDAVTVAAAVSDWAVRFAGPAEEEGGG